RRFAGLCGPMRRTREMLWLVGPTALGSSTLSATIGVLSLLAGSVIDGHRARETWFAWWVGDAIGDLTVAALLLTWLGGPRAKLRWPRVLEAAALVAASILVGASLSLSKPGAAGPGASLAPYLMFPSFPLLIWAALRFGLRGTTASMFLVSIVAIARTA